MTRYAWCEQLVATPVVQRGVPYHVGCFYQRATALAGRPILVRLRG